MLFFVILGNENISEYFIECCKTLINSELEVCGIQLFSIQLV